MCFSFCRIQSQVSTCPWTCLIGSLSRGWKQSARKSETWFWGLKTNNKWTERSRRTSRLHPALLKSLKLKRLLGQQTGLWIFPSAPEMTLTFSFPLHTEWARGWILIVRCWFDMWTPSITTDITHPLTFYWINLYIRWRFPAAFVINCFLTQSWSGLLTYVLIDVLLFWRIRADTVKLLHPYFLCFLVV